MLSQRPITLLRDGHHLAPMLSSPELKAWALGLTGQRFSAGDSEIPSEAFSVPIVEPLGGSVLHLMMRPSLKQLGNTDAVVRPLQIRQLESYLTHCEKRGAFAPADLNWRDLFGLRAVDYIPKQYAAREGSLGHRVTHVPDSAARCRRILLSLGRRELERSDFVSDLRAAKDLCGVNLYIGLDPNNTHNLKGALASYCDALHGTFLR